MELFLSRRPSASSSIFANILGSYWKLFVECNSKSQSLVYPLRADLVKSCQMERRNAYKHIQSMIRADIFVEKGRRLIPTALIFDIGGCSFTPAPLLFSGDLPKKVDSQDLFRLMPRIKAAILLELFSKIPIQKGTLRDHVSISFEVPEHFAFNQEFHYLEFPMIYHLIEPWDQTDPKVASLERELFKVLTRGDPNAKLNGMLKLSPDSLSPFFSLDDDQRDYILAAWVVKRQGHSLAGDQGDHDRSSAFIEEFAKDHSRLSSREFSWIPETGAAPLSQLLLVSSRIKPEGDLVGWYDFRTGFATGRYVHSHLMVSFWRFHASQETKFIRLRTGRGGHIGLISILPASRLPSEILSLRWKSPSRFVQQSSPILFESPCVEAKSLSEYHKMNALLTKAASTPRPGKDAILLQALSHLTRFSKDFCQSINQAVEECSLSEAGILMLNAVCGGRLLFILAMRDKSPATLKSLAKGFLAEYDSLGKVIKYLADNQARPDLIPVLMMTHARQFRDAPLLGVLPSSIRGFVELLGLVEQSIDNLADLSLRLEWRKWILHLEHDRFESALLSKKSLDFEQEIRPVIDAFEKVAKVYADLADQSLRLAKTRDPSKNDRYIFFKNQALYYSFLSVAFRAQMVSQSTGNPLSASVVKALEEFEGKLF